MFARLPKFVRNSFTIQQSFKDIFNAHGMKKYYSMGKTQDLRFIFCFFYLNGQWLAGVSTKILFFLIPFSSQNVKNSRSNFKRYFLRSEKKWISFFGFAYAKKLLYFYVDQFPENLFPDSY
jgi:hypothetical protein